MKAFYKYYLLATVLTTNDNNARPRPSMESELSKMSVIDFGLSFEDYFLTPNKNSSILRRRLISQGFMGLVIDGPRYIPIDKKSQFPIAALSIAEAMQSSRYRFKEFCIATALDLNSGKLYSDYFIEPKFVRSTSERLEDLEKNPPPPGLSSDGGAADLFERLLIPKQAGEYLVTIFLLGEASNQIRVRIGPSDAEHDPKKFAMALKQAHLNESDSETKIPQGKVLSQAKTANSPLMPKESGIALFSQDLSGPQEKFPEVEISGSYRLTGQKRNPDGSISIVLLGTGTRDELPLLKVMNLNSSIFKPSQGNEVAEGFFTLKLGPNDGLRGEQTFYFHALTGEALSKPSKVDLFAKSKIQPEK